MRAFVSGATVTIVVSDLKLGVASARGDITIFGRSYNVAGLLGAPPPKLFMWLLLLRYRIEQARPVSGWQWQQGSNLRPPVLEYVT